ncbi:Aste57867_16056 [Aphanomyces stellatus]|uniref:Aste57867_16056 protein n=1 Tax=Aphanomyces stellatus TaxID=120398 RepID=A0A485L554_9STRA|nr:hypothetical protein As57867_016000 [Aphanomyces stellatus]VFT92840.1 Aste57867_16056 [Aphanomyces stellatus]
MCEISSCGGRVAQDYLSSVETCSTPFNYDTVSPTKENVLKAMLAIDLSVMQRPETLAFACSCATADPAACVVCTEMLANATTMLARYLTPGAIANLRAGAVPVEMLIRDRLNITMVQFYTDLPGDVLDSTTTFTLSAVNLFSDVRLGFAAWLYLIDWVEGRREVVTLVGDAGDVALTTMSDHAAELESPANPREVPTSFSFYTFRLSQYITGVLFGVACLVCIYIIANHGDIEKDNMGAFNVVCGLVWVGRPMILLRALSAICVLATSVLGLAATPVFTRLYADTVPWFTTFLSTGEVSWLVFVIDDIVSVVTRERTAVCRIKNKVAHKLVTILLANSGLLSWISSGIWSAVTPVHHVAVVSRACSIDVVDLDVTCRSGAFGFGIPTRFLGLILLTFGSCFTAYAFRLAFFQPIDSVAEQNSSFFLPAVAKYNFKFDQWQVNDTLYLDKSSAVLTGILILEYHDTLYLFDIKIWRKYTIDVSASRKSMRGHDNLRHVYHALPLCE